jgi:hypothetical protein
VVAVAIAIPSAEARAQLRQSASELDVDDLLELACDPRRPQDPLRVAIYLEALRGRGGEHAQVASCLLLYELVRLGEVHREVELKLLAPVLRERLPSLLPLWPLPTATPTTGVDAVALRIHELHGYVLDSITVAPAIPSDEHDIEIELFDSEEWEELDASFAEVDLDDESFQDVAAIFLQEFSKHDPNPPDRLFSSLSPPRLERLADAGELCRSYAGMIDGAAEILPFVELFFATQVRPTNFLGRRNKERDERLSAGLVQFTTATTPPAGGGGWFSRAERGWQTADDGAWERIADVLLDYCSHLAALADDRHRHGTASTAAEDWVSRYVADSRSLTPPRRIPR